MFSQCHGLLVNLSHNYQTALSLSHYPHLPVLLLHLSPASSTKPLSLTAFSDADWGANPYDGKSISDSCIYLGPNLVSWWSKKQALVTRSSTEAEYRSLANTAVEVPCLQSRLTAHKVPFSTPILLCQVSTLAQWLSQTTQCIMPRQSTRSWTFSFCGSK